jgi:hypothetical protein
LFEHSVDVARGKQLAAFFEAARGLFVITEISMVFREYPRSLFLLPQPRHHFGGARGVLGEQKEFDRFLVSTLAPPK